MDGKKGISHLRFSAFGQMFSLHYVPAFIAIFAMLGMLIYADWQNQSNARQDRREEVNRELGLVKTKLADQIKANSQLIRGLVASIETEPDIDQERFDKIASKVLLNQHQFINIAAAPDLVVRMIYPLVPNKRALGLRYLENPQQRAAVVRARDRRMAVVTGPVNLVQGGQALIIRSPVYVTVDGKGQKFWGVVSAVINLDYLFKESGLHTMALRYDVLVRARASDSSKPEAFYGNTDLAKSDPVTMSVTIGQEDWLISARPKDGWDLSFYEIWRFRLGLLLAELLIVLPIVWAGRLLAERQRNVRLIELREDEMKALSHRLQIALETSEIGVWEFDITNNRLYWDDRMKVLYGVSQHKPVAEYGDWRSALHPDDLEGAEKAFERAIKGSTEYRSQFRVVMSDGSIRYIRATGAVYQDLRGFRKIVGVNWDVTSDVRLQADLQQAKRQAEAQNSELEMARMRMEDAALHDALTGLPNRRFLDQIIGELDQAGKSSEITVFHIDLDRFKEINDTLGHAAGDLILRHAAATLRENIRGGDFLARIGGDEFVIVSKTGATSEEHQEIAARLVETISRPIEYEGYECRVGASVGIAARTAAEEPVTQLLINADIALYEAKRRGRNRVEHFTDSLRLAAINTKKTADEILRGIEQNEFISYFQPQFDANSLEIVGLEALARWDHPSKGILGPQNFLKIAEDLKVVSFIDEIILNQALMQLNRLEMSGFPIPKVSVNISAQRLKDEQLVEKVASMPFRKGSLSFELLESISFDGEDGELVPQIEKLRELGVDIEIDDFGTGYASIVTLLRLTPRRLKIDRQLIQPVVDSEEQQKLVRSIIDIGHSRGIEVVAEGVETMAHVEILRDLGCHVLQGYALARPMSPADLLPFIQNWHNRKENPKKIA